MSSTITYKNNQLSSFNTGTKTLKTNGKYMEDDVIINVSDNNLLASNIKHNVAILGVTGTFGMKMESINNSPAERGTTMSFTGLKAEPLAFACNLEFQGSFSSNRTVYSIIYDGITTSCCTSYRSGSSLLCYKYTTITWTYNNGTITFTSPSASSVGYFQPYNYHLIYFYEE